MKSLLTDPLTIAAAQRLRIRESENNVGNAEPTLNYLDIDEPQFETGTSYYLAK